ncbi:hypothetical protein CRG98_022818 [Punica granatum]|uniref:Uncharacterized protein n=1 Tax=Punica granatum TaxID=22663 RepID=A0A2I0JKK1_PUNGR|nr:hypothetical protein CRG98_022818 [Punica granatum]
MSGNTWIVVEKNIPARLRHGAYGLHFKGGRKIISGDSFSRVSVTRPHGKVDTPKSRDSKAHIRAPTRVHIRVRTIPDLTGIPCPHVIYCINWLGLDPQTLVDEYLLIRRYKKAYHNPPQPLNVQRMWPKADDETILPLTIKNKLYIMGVVRTRMWTLVGPRIARFWIARLGGVHLPVGTRVGRA